MPISGGHVSIVPCFSRGARECAIPFVLYGCLSFFLVQHVRGVAFWSAHGSGVSCASELTRATYSFLNFLVLIGVCTDGATGAKHLGFGVATLGCLDLINDINVLQRSHIFARRAGVTVHLAIPGWMDISVTKASIHLVNITSNLETMKLRACLAKMRKGNVNLNVGV